MLQDGTRIQLELYPNRSRSTRSAMGSTTLKYEREPGGTFSTTSRKHSAKAATYSIDVHYSGNPTETGRFGCFTFKQDTSGHPLDQHRLRG